MSDWLRSVWGHLDHLAKSAMLRFSKRYSSHSFELISAKIYEDIDSHGGIQTVTFLANRPSFTYFVAL